MFGKDKEERPDEFSGKLDVENNLPADGEPGSEKLHYRIVSVDPDCEEEGRFDRHKHDLGYGVVKKKGKNVMMACLKEDQAKRSKASGKESADKVTEPARTAQQHHVQSGSTRPLETIEDGRTSASGLYDDN